MPLSLKIALSSLAAHKLRAVLAMLGVFLGSLALIGVQHVSQAMVLKTRLEAERLGPNLFMARSGQVRFRRSGGASVSDSKTFTLQDAQALMGQLPGALMGAPFIQRQATPLGFLGNQTQAMVVATEPAYTDIRSFHPEWGRFFTAEELEGRERVVVLGRTIAERLFGDPRTAIGSEVRMFRASLTVIGVMEAKGADVTGANQDEQVFVPLTTYMRRLANVDRITGVYIRLADGTSFDGAKAAASALLRRRHNLQPGQQDDFSVLTADDSVRLQREALDLVRTLGLISSSVSFAVGGLGILSIMILMVRMRRLEIGVRRALGARKQDIVRQFLVEAGIMSITGGTLGVGGGLALATVVYSVADFPPTYDLLLVLGAVLGSAALGLASGAYPAWQAAQVEILDVLRSYE